MIYIYIILHIIYILYFLEILVSSSKKRDHCVAFDNCLDWLISPYKVVPSVS